MSFFHLILLAIIQGLTEFLPISSSAHLILLPRLTDLPDQGLTMDVAVHVGTLAAVVLYFRSDVALALTGVPRLLTGKTDTKGARLAFLLLIATIPVMAVGLVFKLAGIADALRSVSVIGWSMLLFGLLLYWADNRSTHDKHMDDWSPRQAIILGLWQALALIPGTSRSGITITGARLLGYAREDAARISMLMSIPTILASGALLGLDIAASGDLPAARDAATGAVFAFFAALGALALMMRLLRSVSFTPYVIYRVALGVILLAIAYG